MTTLTPIPRCLRPRLPGWPAVAAACAASLLWISGPALAGDTSIGQLLSQWSAQAGRPGDVAQGQRLFTTPQGGEWSCASCHGKPPTGPGKHANTGKAIDPLAPGFNARAFTDTARVEKWFRRNCKDVLSRECTPSEKADVLAYLNSLRP